MISVHAVIKENKQVKKENKELKEENYQLKKEKEALEKELSKYKNSNTPSSSNKHLKENTAGLKSKKGAKRGAPNGHKYKTRNQISTKKEVVDSDTCPKCEGKDLKDVQVFKRLVDEVPNPIVPETTEYEIHKKKCLNKGCGHIFIPKKNTTPLKGKFGINVIILVIFIKFILRGVLRKSAFFLDSQFMFKITPASVNAIIERVAKAAEEDFEDLKTRIRSSLIVYADETSFSVMGEKFWVWVFRTEKDTLLVIRPSRGSCVVEEILGKNYSGLVTCDCWSAYNMLVNALIQRCWSHLLRKSKALLTVHGMDFHKKLKVLFEEIKEFNATNSTQELRKQKYIELTQKLSNLVNYYGKYSELKPVVGYIGNKIDQWFTCVLVEGAEPTNNLAEQAIRETVLVRKIIGAFRSENGAKYYETLASLMASWKIQGLDLKDQLRQMLLKNLCFC